MLRPQGAAEAGLPQVYFRYWNSFPHIYSPADSKSSSRLTTRYSGIPQVRLSQGFAISLYAAKSPTAALEFLPIV